MSGTAAPLAALPHFASFLMAGFECTAALAAGGRRLDLLGATCHDRRTDEDYQLLAEIGIRTVREGLAWSQIDDGSGRYDFSRYTSILAAGQRRQIQQIWDLNHFDYPADLDPLRPAFVDRFARYAQAAVRQLRQYQAGTLYLAPINEISFFAWIGADKGWWAPYLQGRATGFRFKAQLVRAAIAAMEAIWQVDADVRFLQIDPFMRRVARPPAGRTAQRVVREFNRQIRFEAWDMLAGRAHPELGGHPKYLDLMGVNYYIHNQEWVISHRGRGQRLGYQQMDWDSPDRVSLALMLQDVYARYRRPLVLTETGSVGTQRFSWWQRTLAEVDEARQLGIPVLGVCAYPAVDRPDSAGFLLPQSGLWDFRPDDPGCQRLPHTASLELLRRYQPVPLAGDAAGG